MNKKLLLLLAVSHFSVDLYGSFLAPLQPYLIARHKLTLTQAGFLASLYSLSASFMQPLYGYWSDRLGRRLFVVAAPLTAAMFMCLLPMASSYLMLLSLLFLGGVGVAAFHPQGSSMTHAISGSSKGTAMSLFISSGNFGSALGPLFIVYVVNSVGVDSTYLAAAPGVLLTISLFVLLPAAGKHVQKIHLTQLLPQLRSSARPLSSVYIIVVFRTLVQLSFLTYMPVHLRSINQEPYVIGWAVSFFLGAGAVGGVIGGLLYDRIGGRRLFLLSSVASPVLLLLSAVLDDPLLLIACYAAGGFFLMMTIPASVLIGQSLVPGAVSTISSLMMGFGWGLGGMMVPIVGKLADLSSIPYTLTFLSIVPLLYLPLAFTLPRKIIPKRVSNVIDIKGGA